MDPIYLTSPSDTSDMTIVLYYHLGLCMRGIRLFYQSLLLIGKYKTSYYILLSYKYNVYFTACTM